MVAIRRNPSPSDRFRLNQISDHVDECYAHWEACRGKHVARTRGHTLHHRVFIDVGDAVKLTFRFNKRRPYTGCDYCVSKATRMSNLRRRPPHVLLAIFLCLLMRRCYPVLLLVRFLYHAIPSTKLKRIVAALFDPNSIRRHSDFSIPTKYVQVDGKWGERLRVNLGDHIGWEIFLHGYFDLVPLLVAITLGEEKRGSVYVDVGANIGDTSVAVALRGIHTVGIDAAPMAISELCHNITINSPIPYTVVHSAVAEQSRAFQGDSDEDYLTIHVPIGNTGAASVHSEWNGTKSSNVSMMALPRSVADVLDSLGMTTINCIKLDVEGAERQALIGMQRVLREQRCPLIFEYRIDHMDSIGSSDAGLVELLPEGYRCYSLACDQVTESSARLIIGDFDPQTSYENVFAVHGTLPSCLAAAASDEGFLVSFAS